jgi:hypothetical protein
MRVRLRIKMLTHRLRGQFQIALPPIPSISLDTFVSWRAEPPKSQIPTRTFPILEGVTVSDRRYLWASVGVISPITLVTVGLQVQTRAFNT